MSDLCFRGTRTASSQLTRLGVTSWTPCLGAAIVWAAQPARALTHSSKATFLPTSTVTAAHIASRKTLSLGGPDESVGQVLRRLRYGKRGGIGEDEARKVFVYLHNRAIGRVSAPLFKYRVFNEDGEVLDERDLPLSLRDPMTLISEALSEFEYAGDEALHVADRVSVDAFALADAPAVQREAIRQKFDAIEYVDAFGGANYAFEDLLGIPPEQVPCLIEDEDPFGDDLGWFHQTVRPLTDSIVTVQWSEPAEKIAVEYVASIRDGET